MAKSEKPINRVGTIFKIINMKKLKELKGVVHSIKTDRDDQVTVTIKSTVTTGEPPKE